MKSKVQHNQKSFFSFRQPPTHLVKPPVKLQIWKKVLLDSDQEIQRSIVLS